MNVSSVTHFGSEGPHPSDNNALTLLVVDYLFIEDRTPLHRVASTAMEIDLGVRFRRVVSEERYKTDRANEKLYIEN
jgi:hypothetical protein